MRWAFFRAAAILWLGALSFPGLSNAQVSTRASAVAAGDSDSVRVILKKRNPTGAMLRSLALPGWGQFYNGKYFKAALAFGAETGLVATAIYWNQRAVRTTDRDERLFYQNNRNTALWWLVGTILYSMLDAYVDASLSDFDESPNLSFLPPAPVAGNFGALGLRIKIAL
ncbi:MAG: DUF5683 domain-containing protein [candidate division KSB1 bacterium]|nr:DUF5683 domain-containing protein [candidate division KSB1 bacterium]MDZ7303546.1 DUF5683 domain-containing protein [candidate division KSB1 bacterium]MDZ7312789.1 DUF5683 domain-containing protein [candidate division KSB1 bacterium]